MSGAAARGWMSRIAGTIGVVALLAAAGCETIPRARTLPPSVRNVYVPIALNRSSHPAIEEDLTTYLQEEILADGRLNLVERRRADAFVEVTIDRFLSDTYATDSQDVGVDRSWEMRTTMKVVRNIPGRPSIGADRKVSVPYIYNADTRSIGYEPEPVIRERALRDLARALNRELMTGEYETPAELQGTQTGP